MKVKPSSKSGSVVLELDEDVAQLPAKTLPEVKLRRILVPVDFSEPSRKALNYAVSFAKLFKAEVLLLHAVEPPSTPPETILTDSNLVNADVEKAAKKRLTEWSKEVELRTAVRATVRVGNPHFQILEEAKSGNVDLIVMGTKGRTALAHLFIGSTAERVVRHAPCPVMVVRERERDFVQIAENVNTFRAEAS
jgi:nucleotide-binding universal stress UspA family protein